MRIGAGPRYSPLSLVAGFVLRVGLGLVFSRDVSTMMGDAKLYWTEGLDLAQEGVFSGIENPTEPQFRRPPGLPFLWALIFRALGPDALATLQAEAGEGLHFVTLFRKEGRSVASSPAAEQRPGRQ